ncbi:cation-translocating P-type ATPase [Candidatus Microgenomates bacterium]|nr:MAG: cation-translocating P-type ATPase [Candidatus Microgenomates bacterium]
MENGLSVKEAQEKLKIFGKNEIKTTGINSPFSIFFSQLPTTINYILAFAAILSFLLKNLLDGIFILAVLFLNTIFGFIQEYKAEKSLEKLKNFVKSNSRVIRNGKETEVPTEDLVPQDLVVLSEGERIPADGKLVMEKHIEIDESILTGESLPVIKKQNDTVYKGTLVIKGRGYLLIEKTGMQTNFGQIATTLSAIETDKTPLQKKLDKLGKILSLGVIIFSLLLIPIGILQEKTLIPLIILTISICIAAIPESLPAVVTIALAIGTNKMAKKQAIVRKMSAVETLGATQVILLDKTGTLTQNAMRVKKTWLREPSFQQDLLKACVFGNTASLVLKDGQNSTNFDVVGDRTDGALLLWAKELGRDITFLKNEGKVVDEYVFDPVTKTITTVWQQNVNDKKRYIFVRGAPETIIAKSNLKQDEREKITSLYEEYAKEGLRVIGFAKKIAKPNETTREHLEKDLDFIGFHGIYDPPREEAKKAVINAKMAGIKTIMVTGDNELTALAIAKEVGLIEKDEDVITGEELKKLSDEELEKIILKTGIFARTKPEDKLRLTRVLKKLGLVVGVTGDGVNDSLALKEADVGVAMGKKGTDVAKEASDIIIVDDNFSTLVSAILEGRNIFNNILKTITYLLSGNLSEISLIFLATVFGMPSPLLPTQILWINLVTDSLPAMALASDNKDHNLLKYPPRNPQTPILTKSRITFITLAGFGIAIFLLVIFQTLLNSFNLVFARTITFNLLILLHLGIALVIRKKSIFSMNRFMLFAIFGTLIIQTLINILPFFQKIFELGF